MTDHANVQLPPVYFQYLSILILSVSILLFAAIFLSFFSALFSFSFVLFFSWVFIKDESRSKNVRRFPGLACAIIADNMSGSAPRIISNIVLLFISRQSLKMRYSQNRRERVRAAPRTI